MKKHDLIKRKSEVLERPASSSAWVPREPGDSVAGIVDSITTRRTRLEQDVTVLGLWSAETGESACVWMMGTILAEEYRKREIAVGDWLCLKFLGMRPGGWGNTYKAFDIEHIRAKDLEADPAESVTEHDDDVNSSPKGGEFLTPHPPGVKA